MAITASFFLHPPFDSGVFTQHRINPMFPTLQHLPACHCLGFLNHMPDILWLKPPPALQHTHLISKLENLHLLNCLAVTQQKSFQLEAF